MSSRGDKPYEGILGHSCAYKVLNGSSLNTRNGSLDQVSVLGLKLHLVLK